jgi:hypothetical protein
MIYHGSDGYKHYFSFPYLTVSTPPTFASAAGKEFIFVVADYSSANIGSLYENSTTSGRWLDFTT